LRVPLRVGIPIVALSAGIGAVAGVLLPVNDVRHAPSDQIDAVSTSTSLPQEAVSFTQRTSSAPQEQAEKMPAIDTAVERVDDTGLALAEPARAEPETTGSETRDPLTSVAASPRSAPSRSTRDAISGSQERQRADAPKSRRRMKPARRRRRLYNQRKDQIHRLLTEVGAGGTAG
jgi:hypothetical protein